VLSFFKFRRIRSLKWSFTRFTRLFAISVVILVDIVVFHWAWQYPKSISLNWYPLSESSLFTNTLALFKSPWKALLVCRYSISCKILNRTFNSTFMSLTAVSIDCLSKFISFLVRQ
jgi:hypothetical protein